MKAVEPGIAEITLVIRLTGPTGLEVREAQIEDAFSGWKPVSSSCASSSAGLGAEWIQEIVLSRQSKPGQVPLPAVKVTFRAGTGGRVGDGGVDRPAGGAQLADAC